MGLFVKIGIIIIVIFLGYFFIPTNKNSFNNAVSLRNTGTNADPIKLQFRNGFQNDTYKEDKKTTFMQQRMADEEEKKTIFWNKK